MIDHRDEQAVLDLLGTLWALDHSLQAVSKRMLRTVGVTSPQRVALRMIGRDEGISPGGLAKRLHDHPSTITGVIQRLEERGLLSRTVDPDDARRAHLHLTDAGKTVNQNHEGTVEAAVYATISRLSPGQLAAASQVLAVLTEELTRIAKPRQEDVRTPG